MSLKVNTISKVSGNNITLNDPINFNNLASDPAANVSAAGDVYYNTTTNKVKFYNGSAWNEL